MPAIKYKKKTYAGATFPVLEMTKAEYDALPSSKQNDGTVYLITDDDGGWEAERSTYDNTESGLAATNVQDALDEISSNIQNLNPSNSLQPPLSGSITLRSMVSGVWTSSTTGYAILSLPWALHTDDYTFSVSRIYIEMVGEITTGIAIDFIGIGELNWGNTGRVRITTTGKTANTPFVGNATITVTKNE